MPVTRAQARTLTKFEAGPSVSAQFREIALPHKNDKRDAAKKKLTELCNYTVPADRPKFFRENKELYGRKCEYCKLMDPNKPVPVCARKKFDELTGREVIVRPTACRKKPAPKKSLMQKAKESQARKAAREAKKKAKK